MMRQIRKGCRMCYLVRRLGTSSPTAAVVCRCCASIALSSLVRTCHAVYSVRGPHGCLVLTQRLLC
jgi:hypothetical protein